jgi:predicted Rossmann fold flavoprotein
MELLETRQRTAPAGPIVVIGAGAAGLMAAVFAAMGDAPVILLERTREGARKILISGGGRCNVLPTRMHPDQFITASSPNSLKKMLLSWPLAEQQRYFERDLGIELVVEAATGKMFPASNRAREVRDALVNRAVERGVSVRFDTLVTDLEQPASMVGPWRVVLRGGEVIEAGAVIVATGGLSVPTTGSDGTGLSVLERLGHTVHPTYPALTPLTADPPRHAALAGVSLDVTIEAPLTRGKFVTHGGFLFTHHGYSGPAVLDISHVFVRARAAHRQQPLFVRWTKYDMAEWDERLRAAGTGGVGPVLRRELPTRLADALMAEARVDPQLRLANLTRESRLQLIRALSHYELPVNGDQGYRKAEVTGGGVSLAEVDPHTMESRVHARLYLCGELLDAFGPIGGYNFAWAWATGRAAGIGAARGR